MSSAPQRHQWPEDETEEQRYWKKQHQREAIEAASEQQFREKRREEIKAALPEIIEAGAAIQAELIATEDGPPEPVIPSLFQGKGEYVVFGIVGTLLTILTTCVLIRHRREAEIRALTGGYLSDGTEVAKFTMPELFAPAPTDEAPARPWYEKDKIEETATIDPRTAFFSAFPEYLTGMREALQELGRTTEEARKQKLLSEMAELIAAFKVEANLWQLRPIMQVSTVLELLLQRLAEKTKDVTPSTLRTIAGALDLLADLAVPDLRPDLLVMPPLQILAVDDEPLCLRAISFALQKANLTPDIAHNGQEAVDLARTKPYDVIFMDIQMPEMDGFTACTKILEGHFNATTPVVFVTVQSDFHTRAKSNLIGGRELMGKPFLIFELTVKAVTYAARKRLKPTVPSARTGPVEIPASVSPAPTKPAESVAAPASAAPMENKPETKAPDLALTP